MICTLGKIMQNNSSVAAYVQRFNLAVMEASDMSEPDKINWFLRGLSPTLKPYCLTDHLGVFWSDLGDLITYAYAKETMLKAQGLVRDTHHRSFAAAARKSKGIKRAKEEDDGFQQVESKQPRLHGMCAAAARGGRGGGRGTGRGVGRGAGRGVGSSAGRGAGRGGAPFASWGTPTQIRPTEGSGPQDNHHYYPNLNNAMVTHCWEHHICPQCFGPVWPRLKGEDGHMAHCKGSKNAQLPPDIFDRKRD